MYKHLPQKSIMPAENSIRSNSHSLLLWQPFPLLRKGVTTKIKVMLHLLQTALLYYGNGHNESDDSFIVIFVRIKVIKLISRMKMTNQIKRDEKQRLRTQ